jgi:hypothetical protein
MQLEGDASSPEKKRAVERLESARQLQIIVASIDDFLLDPTPEALSRARNQVDHLPQALDRFASLFIETQPKRTNGLPPFLSKGQVV